MAIVIIRESRKQIASIPDFLPNMDDYVSQEGDQIMLDPKLDLLLTAVGKKLAQSLKYSFMQGLGAQSKIGKGLKTAMAQDVIDQKMPILNLIGNFLGTNTAEYIGKNPHALAQLAPIIQAFSGGQRNNPSANYGYEGYK